LLAVVATMTRVLPRTGLGDNHDVGLDSGAIWSRVAIAAGFPPSGALLGSNASGSLNRYFFAPACQLVTTVMDSPSAAFSPPPVTFTRKRWPSRKGV